MSIALAFSGVSKSFGSVDAVRSLDLTVPVGTVTVVLGPNGAGKTTSIRLATGVYRPDAGTVLAFGLDPGERGREVRRRTGVVPPKPAMYDRLTGRQNLEYTARLYELDSPAIDDLAERFGIAHALGQLVAGYSTGMRTRLALVRALLHDPEMLLLDEPTAGLDPESAYAVRDLIFDLTASGKTVIMSTHLLHEADGAADQIVLMNDGRAWESGTPAELTSRYWRSVEVRIEAEEPGHRTLINVLGPAATAGEDGVIVRVGTLDEVPDLVERLVVAGVRLRRVEPVVPTLERLYFAMRRQVVGDIPEVSPGGVLE